MLVFYSRLVSRESNSPFIVKTFESSNMAVGILLSFGGAFQTSRKSALGRHFVGAGLAVVGPGLGHSSPFFFKFHQCHAQITHPESFGDSSETSGVLTR